MKTFKLKSLEMIENDDGDITQMAIPLKDGLIINQEDDDNRWIIEALTNDTYFDLFQKLRKQNDTVVVQAKITTENNQPATLITTIASVNMIGSNMNILFTGTIIDRQKGRFQDMLQQLVEQGYQGASLINKFKELI